MAQQIGRARALSRDGSKPTSALNRTPLCGLRLFLSRKLVIEIDGDHHTDQIEADARRTADMEREG